MNDRGTILLVDDHPLFRQVLRERLTGEGFSIAEAATPSEAMDRCGEARPSVAVVDIDLPEMSGLDLAARLLERTPGIRVVFLSAFVHDAYIDRALELQASGYLVKTEPTEVVLEAIAAVFEGATRFSASVLERIVVGSRDLRTADRHMSRLRSLTPREREVLSLVARGLAQKQIATDLGVSVKTVQHHLAHLMDKLDLHDRVDLARFAVREGLVEP